MNVLFVIPCGNRIPSGAVRVLDHLPALLRAGVRPVLLNLYSSFRLRLLDAMTAPDGTRRSRPVRALLRMAGWLAGRLHEPLALLRALALARRFDVVFLQWVVPPAWAIRALRRRAPRLVFDMDDAVWLLHPARTDLLVRCSDCVVAGSRELMDYAQARNPRSILLPSGVPVERYAEPADAAYEVRDRPFRLGWIGGPSTVKYLAMLEEPARRLRASGHAIVFVLAGTGSASRELANLGETVVHPTYRPADLPALVVDFDIGLMPLEDGPWERAKCAMKALVYMAGAKPVVASPVGEATRVIEDGVNGLLAADAPQWVAHLERLMSDVSLRRSIGRAGRATVVAHYNTARLGETLFAEALHPRT